MKARKDDIETYFNWDLVDRFIDEGWTIMDDDGIVLDDPKQYAREEEARNTHFGNTEDFIEFCRELGIEVIEEN